MKDFSALQMCQGPRRGHAGLGPLGVASSVPGGQSRASLGISEVTAGLQCGEAPTGVLFSSVNSVQ